MARFHLPAGGPGNTRPPDDEFIGGKYDEASLVTLDFDDDGASSVLHEREPDDDFAFRDDDRAGSGEFDADGCDALEQLDRLGIDGDSGFTTDDLDFDSIIDD